LLILKEKKRDLRTHQRSQRKSNLISELVQEMRVFIILTILCNFSYERELVGSGELWSRPNHIYKTNPIDDYIPKVPKGSNKGRSVLDGLRMPGTNWCGKGWRSDALSDLGGFASADRCCRQHDLGCKKSIQPGETKYGLTNRRIHTIMHCDCDDMFRSCLKMAKTTSANTVGNMFFNFLSTPCYVVTEKEVCGQYTWWGKCKDVQVIKKAMWRKPAKYYNH